MHSPSPPLTPRGGDGSDVYRKYHVIIEAEGADGLDVEPGKEVSFVFKRHGKVSISHCAEVWDDGICYWDAKLSQVCTMARDPDGSWRPRPCSLLVQSIALDSTGEPMTLGQTVASAALDLAPLCDHDQYTEPTEPQRMTLPLEPTGSVTILVSSCWLKDWAGLPTGDEDVSAAVTPATATPAASGSLSPSGSPPRPSPPLQEESSVTFGGYCRGSESPSVVPKSHAVPSIVDSDAATSRQPSTVLPLGDRAASLATPCASGTLPTVSGASSSALEDPSSSSMSAESEAASIEALQRRCRRLERERDEARAESFAEASVAVQRGIEIDNLKRAKEMLLQRLENAERQLMMAMRFEPESPSSTSTAPAAAAPATAAAAATPPSPTPSSAAPYGDAEAVVHALVEAKVALAEREFDVMELQGQLRAKEAHIEALTAHLAAVRAAAEERAAAAASPATHTGRSMRSVWGAAAVTPPWSTARGGGVRTPTSPRTTAVTPLGDAMNAMFSRGYASASTTPTAAQVAAAAARVEALSLQQAAETQGVVVTPLEETPTKKSTPVVHIFATAAASTAEAPPA